MTTFWGREWQVNASGTGDQRQPDVAVLSNGDYVITYMDANPATDVVRLQRFNGFGEPIGGEIVVGTTSANDARPSITALPNGAFAVAWAASATTISLQKFLANGTPDGGVIAVASNGSAGFFQSMEILGLADGSIAVAYTKEVPGGEDVILKIVAANGTVGSEIVVDNLAGSSQSTAYIASDGNNLVVSWYDASVNGGDIQARTFSLTGTSPGTEVTLNTSVTSQQIFSPLTALAGGSYVTVWEADGSSLRGQITTSSLSKLGSEFILALDQSGTEHIAIAATQNGGFFVAYRALDGALYGLSFDELGARTGPRIRIADGVSGTNTVALAALPDGRIAATWTDVSGLDGSGSGIFTRIIDPRDGVVDGTGVANTLYGHQFEADQISGFGGNDTIFALGGDDIAYGGAGNDLVFGWTGRDVLWGDQGNDTLHGEQDNDVLLGVDGNDLAFGGDGNDTLYGWFGQDTLWGGNGDDLILGEQDNDLILGEGGNDQLDGNDGNDTLYGFFGFDTLLGGNGTDLIYGEGDNDLAFGSVGNDTIFGGDGNDSLFGEQDDDILLGELGFDLLNGQEGNDTLYGFDGDDTLFGFTGNDQLFGEAGNDIMLGEDGNDFLGGLDGNDFMVGGKGADTLWGDGGDDTFVFTLADLQNGISDEINSFAEVAFNFDRIRFEGIAPGAVSTGQIGPNTVINVAIPGGTATIIVTNFNAGAIGDQLIFA